MLRLLKVNEIAQSFIKLLFSRNDPHKSIQCAPYGFDSKPIVGAQAVMSEAGNKNIIVGYLYQSEETVAGEPRMYATDAEGTLLGSVKLNQSGECVVNGGTDYAVAFEKLKAELEELKGVVNANANIDLAHTHTYAPGPLPPVQTGPLVGMVQTSSADFDNAKVEKIRV